MTIVLVPGLFGVGFAPAAVRRAAAALLASGARLVVVTPGAVSSVHDCAREVFAQLRGGVVDYGEAHAARAGHARYGRTWPALVPEWSAARPVHLVGFSMGGLVCRELEWQLRAGELGEARGEWVASVSTVHTPNHGSDVVHLVGLSSATLRPLPLSPLWCIFQLIYLIVWLRWTWLLEALQLRLEHWGRLSLRDALTRQHGRGDNAGRDLSPAACAAANERRAAPVAVRGARRAALFAFTGTATARLPFGRFWHALARPRRRTLRAALAALALCPTALFVGVRGRGAAAARGAQLEEHHANDGIVSAHSQGHPELEPSHVGGALALRELLAMPPAAVTRGEWWDVRLGEANHTLFAVHAAPGEAFLVSLCAFLLALPAPRPAADV